MRSIYKILSVIGLCLVTVQFSSAISDSTAVAKKASGIITIDGFANEATWSHATGGTFGPAKWFYNENNSTPPTDAYDFSCKWKSLYNDTALFLFIEVWDNILVGDQFGLGHYERDKIECYFDFSPTTTTDWWNADCVTGKYQIPFLLDNQVKDGGNACLNKSGYNWVVEETTNGYNIEAYITWATIPPAVAADFTVAKDASFLFDVQIIDNDQTSDTKSYRRMNWASDKKGWDDLTGLGTLTLGDITSDVKTFKNSNFTSVYPSPVSDVLQISKTVDQVSIINLVGKVVLTDMNVDKINVSKLAPGIYIVSIKNGDTVKQEKIIKK